MLPGGWKAGERVAFCGGAKKGLGWVACCAEGPLAELPKAREAAARLAASLPAAQVYELGRFSDATLDGPGAAFGWALGAYAFQRYKRRTPPPAPSRLVWPVAGTARAALERSASATYLVRDLVSTPAEDMGPAALERVARDLADAHGARVTAIVGDDLLAHNYPQVHAVGRAAAPGREPRVVHLDWGDDPDAPLVVLVGKGVTFDTGGLDIKPAQAMLTMKKDMGGAANVLGLADMVMAANLPLRLRVALGCVENSISGSAFRPGDVLVARNGYTSEIGNTDAEGRLVLADLLVEAVEARPDLVVDVATLTGAARVALGTDVPVLFCNDDALAAKTQALSSDVGDDVWRLPLWSGYEKELDSPIADCKNVGSGPYGSAITAALYLQRFLTPMPREETAAAADNNENEKNEEEVDQSPPPWIHIDVMAYNTKPSPGRPEGGEAMGMRALFALLEDRYPRT
ncbi:hypothetical protein CTAYLR_008298 [Chrysophaeum taylorii]|uniref:Cytosol aminopeptidase domain-containing protein n=1 Tax=Chrysophaeum taylorii TaxID=2483200 RepID=A0AAD7U6I0_9STRA|nr:hypothetical protein CTAYLR_008298 [Chrysophaeum taylorii]